MARRKTKRQVIWTRHDQLYVVWDLKFFPQRLQVLRGDRHSKVVHHVHWTASNPINYLHIRYLINQDTVDPDWKTATMLMSLDGLIQEGCIPGALRLFVRTLPSTRCTWLPGHSHSGHVLFLSQVHDLETCTSPWLLQDPHTS